jgi:predicted GNAT family acetyltransferase
MGPGGEPMYKQPMDTYLIIGNSNTRKASVIRSLTGCFNRSVRDILIQGARSPLRCYARAGALQDTSTTVDAFIAEVARSRCKAVICCLVPSAMHKNGFDQSDAQTYVEGFRAAGWRIKAVAVLGQDSGGVRATNLRQYPQAPSAPINVTAREVRAQFGWI